jgi:hypothetical protein
MKTVTEKYDGRLFTVGHKPSEALTLERLFENALTKGAGLVILDYLTRLKPVGVSDLIFTEIAINRIHEFARSNQIAFLILSQMGRASRQIQSEGGTSFSRGSGVTEEISTAVLSLQRSKTPVCGDDSPIVLTIEKARHGIPGGLFWLERDAPTMAFTGRAQRVELQSSRKPTVTLTAIDSYLDTLNGGERRC